MAVLVTRPSPDNLRTADALRARGFAVLLAPMLRFEPLPLPADLGGEIGAVIATSANALRAAAPQLTGSPLTALPLFAVGGHTAAAAGAAGFANVVSADGDATALCALIVERAAAGSFDSAKTLLYLAGSDISRDLASELSERGFHVLTATVYRMAQVTALPRDVCEAFAQDSIEAVLHYSRRSASAFVAAARADGVEIAALALPQCCISAQVAEVLREAGASRVTVAESPDEQKVLEGLARALRS